MRYILHPVGTFVLLAAAVMFPCHARAADLGNQWPSWIGRIDAVQDVRFPVMTERAERHRAPQSSVQPARAVPPRLSGPLSTGEWPDIPPQYRPVSYEMYLQQQQKDTALPPRIVSTGAKYRIEKAPELWPKWIGLPPWYRK